jgi:hypothetical protein
MEVFSFRSNRNVARARLGSQLYNIADSSGIWVGLWSSLMSTSCWRYLSVCAKPHEVKDNFNLGWGLTTVAVVCMWLLWLCCYMHQMYPLITPKLE